VTDKNEMEPLQSLVKFRSKKPVPKVGVLGSGSGHSIREEVKAAQE